MTRMSRRRLLRLGGLAAAGAAGSMLLPDAVLARAHRWADQDGKQPPGQLKKRIAAAQSETEPVPEATATPAETIGDAAASPYRALDTDFGVYGVQDQRWFDAARAEGYDGFITTLHTNWDDDPRPWLSSHVALEQALNAGMWIAAYGRPVSSWREALGHLPRDLREQLKFFALDVEPEPGRDHRLQQEYADGVEGEFGVRPLVYTGWGMWGDVMGSGNGDFAHLPLWDFAGDRFDWPEEMTEEPLVEYGGWNVPGNYRVGWQVQMQQPAWLNGVNIDRDLFSREFIDAV